MSALIDEHFIDPLAAYYGKGPGDQMRPIIAKALDGLGATELEACAEWLKLNRKAMTFPGPSDCSRARRLIGAPTPAAVAALLPLTGVTGADYAKRAAEYAKAVGGREFPVINRWTGEPEKSDETPEWSAWQAYFRWLRAKAMLSLTWDRATWTFPTKWPWEFDANFSKEACADAQAVWRDQRRVSTRRMAE